MSIKILMMVLLGYICLIIGIIGIFIPVWPTTPFFLLSVGCFSATPKLKQRMLKIPFFKEHLINYQNRNGLALKSVISSLVFLWLMILLSIYYVGNIYMSISLIIIAILVSIHIIYMSKPKRGKHNEE